MSRWFRYYDDALDDPKVQRLSGELFKAWVNLLALASKGGGKLPSVDDIAFRLRMSAHDAQQRLDDLILAGLIDILPDKSLSPHGWSERQYVSDTSTDRVRKYREKKAKPDETFHETDDETERNVVEPESEPDKIQKTEQTSLSEVKAGSNFDQGGKASRGVSPRLKETAEGLGLRVAELVQRATAPDIDQPNAYFRRLAQNELSNLLPGASETLIKTALTKDGDAARQTVYQMLMEVPTHG